ncbi:efflux RND transporter periplasmic adaptor subunit [Desmospora profundinema]|uniref:HlyD family secretion protein n=1 Tax=Desmospora profundinema TaxID=1571184 RepID=A0ABU1IQF1_9BACL|nr:efflux RND transporter periplasmic adaptor subunit [Desmospora profundinema]MDR6227014.1 HlyD family secretion protein [Desmospora profundinema]
MNLKKAGIGAAIVVTIAGMIAFSYYQSEGGKTQEVEVLRLKQETFTETIMTSGVLESRKQQQEYFQAERGTVEEIHVKPGDSVDKGDALVRYGSPDGGGEIRQAELGLEQAKLSRSDLYRQLENIRKQAGGRGSDAEKDVLHQIRVADLEVAQAESQLSQARQKYAGLIIKSEQKGTVIRVNPSVQMGENGGPMITVADLKQLKVDAEVSEFDAVKVKEGQSVIVRSDSVEKGEWMGTVKEVAFAPEERGKAESSQVVFPVEIHLDDPPPLKLGSNLVVEITITEKKALGLPASAVVERNDRDVVFVVEKGIVREREVKTGTSDSDHVEILSGVGKTDSIVAAPPEDLSSGAEVVIP